MAVRDTVRIILKDKSITQAELSRRLDTSRANLNNKLQRDTFSTAEVAKIADVLDMKLIFKDPESGTEYPLEYTEEEMAKARRVDKPKPEI